MKTTDFAFNDDVVIKGHRADPETPYDTDARVVSIWPNYVRVEFMARTGEYKERSYAPWRLEKKP